jgi:ATP-dependent Lhr-like helicase
VVGILLERPLVEDPAAHLAWAHALVRDWFLAKFGWPTEPQIEGWPPIVSGKDTLISAPTGSGKTLAAFLACIDRLVRKALDGRLQDCTEVLYISPLKALGNDIQKNLEVPLGEIQALAGERGLLMPTLRAAVRTGDTLMHERRALLKKPPHILVTRHDMLHYSSCPGAMKKRQPLNHTKGHVGISLSISSVSRMVSLIATTMRCQCCKSS